MREREQVGEMATANGCGRHVAFACPDESPNGAAWVWFVPHAGWTGWEASIRLVNVAGGSSWWSQLPVAVFFLTAAVASVAVLALPRYQRRAGGPAPRLYCFEDGVVVATGRVLRPFGRQEISIGRVTWRGHEDVGTRRTLKGPDGSVLVLFTGRRRGLAHREAPQGCRRGRWCRRRRPPDRAPYGLPRWALAIGGRTASLAQTVSGSPPRSS